MADRGLYYGSLGRQALASSYAALDGVPFKISSNFRQPPKIISHPVLEGSGNSNAFDEEYLFETEEAVLAWARARDEAIKKAKQEAERAAEAIAAQKKAALTQNEVSTDSESDDSSQNESTFPNSSANHSNNVTQGISQNQCSNQSHGTPQTVVPKPPIPKPAPRIGTILKPTPIQKTNKANDGNESSGNKPGVPTSTSSERFDITMFEQERDPFDDLELQTVNEMEELKALLDHSSNLATAGKEEDIQSKETNQMNIPTSGSDENLNASESVYELAAPITTDAWVTFDNTESSQACVSPALSTDSNKGGMIGSNSDSPVSDAGDYVKLSGQIHPPNSLASNVNGMAAQRSMDLPTNISSQQGNPFGSQLPPHLAGTGLFKAVLPPIPKPRQSALIETANNNTIPQSLPTHANSAVMSASVLSNSSQDAHKADQSYFPGVKQTNGYNGYKPARVAPPPPAPKSAAAVTQSDNPKMWSSVGPSLASSLEDNTEEINPTNPYSRHSMEWHGLSNSPDFTQGQRSSPNPNENLSQSSSSTQLWNRYRPLPPAPSPKPSDIQACPPQRPPNQVMGLTDPYYSLSKDGQAFTDRITTMGFLRAKVARAVDKFGQDEKEVIDHLIAVDTLEQKKFAPLYAEIALHKCQNDCEKAELFLQMQSQFEELGFSREKIQDALVQSDMNHDKALDLLTACTP